MELQKTMNKIDRTIDILNNSGNFKFVFETDGLVFVANELKDLTSFISPSLRKNSGSEFIDFDICLTVLCEKSLENLKDNIRNGKYLALPKIIPFSQSMEMLVLDGGLSDWLVKELDGDLLNYSKDSNRALELLNSLDDKFINKMKLVYGKKFDEELTDMLLEMRRSGNCGG
jgi:hypothetical protein